MKMTNLTKSALAYRRQRRELVDKGFEYVEGPWQIMRGGRTNERIVEVVIAEDGKGVYVKCEARS